MGSIHVLRPNDLIANYINPIISEMEVQAVTPRVVDSYIQTLQKTPSVSTKTRKAVTTYVSDKTIEKIIKLLRCTFKQAVRWELIGRNPFDNVILPKTEYTKRNIWDADMLRTALDKVYGQQALCGNELGLCVFPPHG